MAAKLDKAHVLKILRHSDDYLSSPELLETINNAVPERTLRRWLSSWVDQGLLTRVGNRRSTRYRPTQSEAKPTFAFLEGLGTSRKNALLGQLRDLWTHHSTAVEGNTLTLGDTHFVLEQGLTIAGKPIKDHQEVIGHSRAIDILYKSLSTPITEQTLFDLHNAVQTEHVTDIYKPNGAWKVEPNGTNVVTRDNQQIYLEYAKPKDVPHLMREVIDMINVENHPSLELVTAPKVFAKVHAAIAHIHPFWDGNGRIARLLSNIPLLRAGLPPIVIPVVQRQEYIQILAEYEIAVGPITQQTGAWPAPQRLTEFVEFCSGCYDITRQLVEEAHGGNTER